MSEPRPIKVDKEDGRFARLEAIEWWDQVRVARARVLLVGAGALGNEILKNLALLGVGHIVVVDRDRVEPSNLCRSVLFREPDQGRPKAQCAAESARRLYPDLQVRPVVGDVQAAVGLGWFRWADAVLAALDNREARVFVNSACARVGRPWFDGGIEVLQGIARGFQPPATACYECTMSQADWDLVHQQRSCSLVARRAARRGGTPTTPTAASIIGALMVQEFIKHLHGQEALLGRGWVLDGASLQSFAVQYPVAPDCPWHDPAPPVLDNPDWTSDTLLSVLWESAQRELGGVDALELSREIVSELTCPRCAACRELWRPAAALRIDDLVCDRCRVEAVPRFTHALPAGSARLRRPVRELGLPDRDILWARRGEVILGLQLAPEPAREDLTPNESPSASLPCPKPNSIRTRPITAT